MLKKSNRGMDKKIKQLVQDNLGMQKLLKNISATLTSVNTAVSGDVGGAGESRSGGGTSSFRLPRAGSDVSEDPSEYQSDL
jgi:hypothetical protein